MIADPDRGSAWTNALLGLLCTEIHLTGDERAHGIVSSLLEETEDLLVMREYKRMSPLTVEKIVGGLQELKEGDCIVAFSRKMCHKLRKLVEQQYKCSIIYGNLPPETRRAQALRFNTRSDSQILISTDAIGMGLNYNISRVIFYETEKNDGKQVRPLTSYEVKQISGRAGRHLEPGFVTAFDEEDHARIRRAIETNSAEKPLKRAAVFPQFDQLEAFATDLQSHVKGPLKFSTILERFADLAHLGGKFFLQHIKDACFLAEAINHVPLSLHDTYKFTRAPVRQSIPESVRAFVRFAEDFHKKKKVTLRGAVGKGDPLEKLEHRYFVIELYLWLARRYEDKGVFPEEDEARHELQLCCDKIEAQLELDPLQDFSKKSKAKRFSSRARRSALSKSLAGLNLQSYNQPIAHRMLLSHLSSLETSDPSFDKYNLIKAIRKEIEQKFGEQLANSESHSVSDVVRSITESKQWEDFCERLLAEILTGGKSTSQAEISSGSDSEAPIAVEKLPAIEELKSIMSDMSARQRSKALAALQHFNPSDLVLHEDGMMVMAALKDALADTNAKTRRQAAEYFAAAFGDATQMCPAKTGPLLTLFCEHMLVYRGEDVLKHAKLLLAFLEDVPGMWLTYSSAELAQVFATGKMIILHTKLTQLLYKVDPSAKWWALWTLPRFARMKLVTLVDWDSGNIYRPYFDVLVARLYMFADARGSLPTGTFERLVDTAVSGNAFVADYLKRSAYAKHFDWVRKVLLQLRISVEGNNIDTAIAICKILSLSPLSQDVVSAVSTVVTSTSDFRLLKEAIGMLQTKETVGVVLQQYHRGMEMQSQSLVHFDYFLATCIATLKEVTSEPSGAEMALTHPFAKDFVLRLGCDLLEAFDLKAAYILSVFSLFAAGRKLINDCKVFPALVKHLCHAAESRDEPRVRDLLPVVRAVAWLERTLLEETDRTAIDELVSMKSHACNWESEEAGKNVFRVLEGAWVIRSTLGERFEEWKADEEGISVQNENREIGIPLVSLLPGSQERSGKNAIPSPLQIYLTHLVPRPAIVEQYNYDFNASVSASALESQSRLAAGIRICNYMKGEGISPYAVIAKWREYHYLSILPGAVALALARVEDEEKRGRTEWKLLACLMNAALASGKPLVDIAASRFCVEQNLQELILASSL